MTNLLIVLRFNELGRAKIRRVASCDDGFYGWGIRFHSVLLGLLGFAVLHCPASGADEPQAANPGGYSWLRTENSLALRNGEKTVWQLGFDPASPKSFFHPLSTVEGEVLTAFEPRDHPWHRGLWWSWKFIDGINYWEEDPKTRTSEGVTELTATKVEVREDFGADVELRFRYHPPGKPDVLTEVRNVRIEPPDADGTYWIDWTSEFTAGGAVVKLDRTPPPNHGGPAYGGYAGLSLRLRKGLEGWAFLTSEGHKDVADGHGKTSRWVDFSGPTAGISIFDHPENPRHPQSWYLSNNAGMAFFSPSPLFQSPMELATGQRVKFRYRVMVHSKPITAARIEHAWRAFASPSQP